jgi:hypothetical protein
MGLARCRKIMEFAVIVGRIAQSPLKHRLGVTKWNCWRLIEARLSHIIEQDAYVFLLSEFGSMEDILMAARADPDLFQCRPIIFWYRINSVEDWCWLHQC